MDAVNIFKALGDENRIRILNMLMKEELCVCEIETILNMTQSNVSRHLIKLKSADIIESEKVAQWAHYKISNRFIEQNDYLYQFLKAEAVTNIQCQKDIERLYKYKNSNFNCEHIRANKSEVEKFLEGEQ